MSQPQDCGSFQGMLLCQQVSIKVWSVSVMCTMFVRSCKPSVLLAEATTKPLSGIMIGFEGRRLNYGMCKGSTIMASTMG